MTMDQLEILMTRRPGMSLTEVLVALFILTLGVIGILTMFPLGAAQMARAVRDDRSAQAAAQADGFMRWYWQTCVINPAINPNLFANGGTPAAGLNYPSGTLYPGSYTLPADSYLSTLVTSNPSASTCLFDNPATLGGNVMVATTPPMQFSQLPAINLSLPNAAQLASYPVIVDPLGYVARPLYLGDASTNGYAPIPRCSLYSFQNQYVQPNASKTFPMNNMFYYRVCSLTDSLGYNDNGSPTNDLEMRYNWFWVLQRPQMITENSSGPTNLFNNQSNTVVVNMTVVVFDRRTFQYPSSSVPGFEIVMPNTSFTTGSTTITISAASSVQAMDLKPGSWVMDASSIPGANPPIRQANFYRVVSVVPVGGGVNLELQTPIAAPTGYNPLGFQYTGTLVALTGVSGVFVRPPLTPYPQ